MWLPKDEKDLLNYYYKKWIAGSSSFPHRKPLDEKSHLHLRDLDLIKFDEIRVSLTPNGLHLGQIYNSWWLRSNLWYMEHIKNHWILVIIAFVVGVISTLLVNWISKVLGVK
jgi:hypothetical protein